MFMSVVDTELQEDGISIFTELNKIRYLSALLVISLCHESIDIRWGRYHSKGLNPTTISTKDILPPLQ